MRKITLLLMALVMTISANAQFKAGKGYVGASLTGLDLHYNGQDKLNLGAEAKAGYLPWDNIMFLAEAVSSTTATATCLTTSESVSVPVTISRRTDCTSALTAN